MNSKHTILAAIALVAIAAAAPQANARHHSGLYTTLDVINTAANVIHAFRPPVVVNTSSVYAPVAAVPSYPTVTAVTPTVIYPTMAATSSVIYPTVATPTVVAPTVVSPTVVAPTVTYPTTYGLPYYYGGGYYGGYYRRPHYLGGPHYTRPPHHGGFGPRHGGHRR